MKRDSMQSIDINESAIHKSNGETQINLYGGGESLRRSGNLGRKNVNNFFEVNKTSELKDSTQQRNINCSSRMSCKSKKFTINNLEETENLDENKLENQKISSILYKSEPRRLMAAINLLVNVKGFYRKLSRNSRQFEKLSINQFHSIGDVSSIYQINQKYWQTSFVVIKFFLNIIKQVKLLTSKIPQLPKLSPFSISKRVWDLLQAFCILANSFLISIFFFFGLDLNEYHYFLKVCFFFFLLDIFVTFNTGILQEGNVLYDSKKIAKYYLKQNLIYDTIGSLPLIYFAFQDQYSPNEYNWILFLLFYLKLRTCQDIAYRMYLFFGFQKNMKPFLDLIKLIFLIVSVCHIFSLFWHGLAVYEIHIGREDTWLHAFGLINQSIWKRYIYSFYFLSLTMITVGYGDITPQNPLEICFTIVTMFITAIFWAFFLNTVGKIIENIEKQDKLFNQNMEIIHKLMREEQVDSKLRVKISNYLKYLYKVMMNHLQLQLRDYILKVNLNLNQFFQLYYQEFNEVQRNSEKQITSKLSKQLQEDLLLNVQGKYLKDIPILERMKSKKEIAYIMEEVIYSPGEYIYQQNYCEDCSLYYIVKGQVDILFSSENRRECVIKSLERQQYFGEISFILGQPRNFSAKAITFCRVYKIPRNQFLKIIKQNVYDFENFQMVKDALQLKNNFKFCNISCSICDSSNHLAQNCPQTHLTLPKQTLICRFNATSPHLSRNFQIRKQFKFSAIGNMFKCYSAIFEINDKKELFDILDDLESLANPNEYEGRSDEEIIEEKDYEEKDDQKFNQQKTFGYTKYSLQQSLFSKQSQPYESVENLQVQFDPTITLRTIEKQSRSGQMANQSQQRFSISSLHERLAFEEKLKMHLEEKQYQEEEEESSQSTLQKSQSLNSPTHPKSKQQSTQKQMNELQVLQNTPTAQSKQYKNNFLIKAKSVQNNNLILSDNSQLEGESLVIHKMNNQQEQGNQVFEDLNQIEVENKSQGQSGFDSQSSLMSKVPTRMMHNNDKKLNSFNSFKDGGSQNTQKKLSHSENIKTQSSHTKEPSQSPKHQNEQKQRQFQQHLEPDQQQNLKPRSQPISQQSILTSSNSPYFQMKKSRQAAITSSRNIQKKQTPSQTQIVSQIENINPTKSSQALQVSQTNSIAYLNQYLKSFQKILEQSVQLSQLNQNLPLTSQNQLKFSGNTFSSGNQEPSNQQINKIEEQLHQIKVEEDFSSRSDINYFILQVFDRAQIFQYYNPSDNYDNVILSFQKLQKVIAKQRKLSLLKKGRKKSRFKTFSQK